ncbi:glycosyltransferase family 2 protein [Thermotomaculum hydrothermale]|nr:glycosyltransferase family 2 protein [Thermotomaculum hydrothermale]
MRVSVVIPTFNRKNFVIEAIKSVVEQSVSPYEIIVVDDGSQDGTGEILKKAFPDIVYIYQENNGVSAARNRGIKEANGDYIALLDSDDLWKKNKLKKHIEFIKQNPHFRVSQTDEVWIRRGKFVNPMKKHKKYGGYIFEKCLPLCIVSPSAVIIEKSVFEDYGYFDESMPACEDYDMWLRISAFEPIGLLEEKLIIKRGGHEDQLSKSFIGMDRFRVYALEKIINNPNLKGDYRKLAIEELIKKCEILVKGYSKHSKSDVAQYYRDLMEKYKKL